jgi:hypothetical protein
MIRRSGALLVAPLFAFAAASVMAATLHVPSQHSTIQAGIDASVHGDVVLVAPGFYTGPGNSDVSFLGKNVTLRSEAGPAVTAIHPLGQAMLLQNGETAASIEGRFWRGRRSHLL